MGTDTQPTPAGKAFADVIERMTGGPRPFFREGYAKNFGFNFVVLLNAVAGIARSVRRGACGGSRTWSGGWSRARSRAATTCLEI